MKAVELEAGEISGVPPPTQERSRGISVLDLVLRAVAVVGTLASAVSMGTANQTLPFFTQFTQFKAQYNDLPTFTFFVIANCVVCGYLVLSLPLSIFHIVRSGATISRVILIFLDTVMLSLLSAGASAAAAVVYLAYKGNASANWLAICQQFNNFCQRISESLIGSFVVILVFMLLILLSAIALMSRRRHFAGVVLL